jgi:hypothetical protein
MNTQQQAYIEGFVKRASEYGFSEAEAIELLKESSTRYMRELREGTPAGKQIEEEMVSRMGKDNTDLIKNNPKGINFLSGKVPNVNPELSEALLDQVDARAAKNPGVHRSLYKDLSRDTIARLEAGSHIRDMSKFYLKGTHPGLSGPNFPGMFEEAKIDPTSGNIKSKYSEDPKSVRQRKINHLSSKAKERFAAGQANELQNIEQANFANYHQRIMREQAREAAEKAMRQKAYGAAKGMKEVIHPPSGLVNKLKSLLRRK